MNDDIMAAARRFYRDNAPQHLDRDRDLLIARCAEQIAKDFGFSHIGVAEALAEHAQGTMPSDPSLIR